MPLKYDASTFYCSGRSPTNALGAAHEEHVADLARSAAIMEFHHPTGRERREGPLRALVADAVVILRQEPGVNRVRRGGIGAQPPPHLQSRVAQENVPPRHRNEQQDQERTRRRRGGTRSLSMMFASSERVPGRGKESQMCHASCCCQLPLPSHVEVELRDSDPSKALAMPRQ